MQRQCVHWGSAVRKRWGTELAVPCQSWLRLFWGDTCAQPQPGHAWNSWGKGSNNSDHHVLSLTHQCSGVVEMFQGPGNSTPCYWHDEINRRSYRINLTNIMREQIDRFWMGKVVILDELLSNAEVKQSPFTSAPRPYVQLLNSLKSRLLPLSHALTEHMHRIFISCYTVAQIQLQKCEESLFQQSGTGCDAHGPQRGHQLVVHYKRPTSLKNYARA